MWRWLIPSFVLIALVAGCGGSGSNPAKVACKDMNVPRPASTGFALILSAMHTKRDVCFTLGNPSTIAKGPHSREVWIYSAPRTTFTFVGDRVVSFTPRMAPSPITADQQATMIASGGCTPQRVRLALRVPGISKTEREYLTQLAVVARAVARGQATCAAVHGAVHARVWLLGPERRLSPPRTSTSSR